MRRNGFCRVLLEFGGWKSIGSQAAIRVFPESRGEKEPASAINNDTQRRIIRIGGGGATLAELVQIIPPVLGDAQGIATGATLRHVDEKTVAGLGWWASNSWMIVAFTLSV